MYIAVASGKGGTGKTLVSTSLALCAGECAYVDLDVEEPNGYIFLKPVIEKEIRCELPVPQIDEQVCTFCGECAKACAYNALMVMKQLKKTLFFADLCHSCGACAYVCPVKNALKEVKRTIGKISTGKTGTVKFIEGRLDVGRPSGVPLIACIINDFLDINDLLIVDASPGTSCPVVESLKKSDYVILVTEPTPFGLHDLELTIEIVKELGKEAGIIINKDNGRSALIEDFAARAGIPVLLKIPYSMDIQRAYSEGIPLIEAQPGRKEKFKEILKKLTAGIGQ